MYNARVVQRSHVGFFFFNGVRRSGLLDFRRPGLANLYANYARDRTIELCDGKKAKKEEEKIKTLGPPKESNLRRAKSDGRRRACSCHTAAR